MIHLDPKSFGVPLSRERGDSPSALGLRDWLAAWSKCSPDERSDVRVLATRVPLRLGLGDHRKQLPVLVRQYAREALDRREPDLRLAGSGLEAPRARWPSSGSCIARSRRSRPSDSSSFNPSLRRPRRPLPLLRLKHLIPHLLHRLEPQRGEAGERGDSVAPGLVVNDQAVADQAQRLDVVGGVAQRLLDVEQERESARRFAFRARERVSRAWRARGIVWLRQFVMN